MLVLAVLVLPGCASAPTRQRVETFRVDAARRAFTLEVDAPGEPLVRYAGDESGRALVVTVGGKAAAVSEGERRRGELKALLERELERLADLPEASGDAAWMRRFRDAYAGEPSAGGDGGGVSPPLQER